MKISDKVREFTYLCRNGMKRVKREEKLSAFNNATLVKVLEPLSDEDG